MIWPQNQCRLEVIGIVARAVEPDSDEGFTHKLVCRLHRRRRASTVVQSFPLDMFGWLLRGYVSLGLARIRCVLFITCSDFASPLSLQWQVFAWRFLARNPF